MTNQIDKNKTPNKIKETKYLFQEIHLNKVIFDESITISGKKRKNIYLDIEYPAIRSAGSRWDVDISGRLKILNASVEEEIPVEFNYSIATEKITLTKNKPDNTYVSYAPPVLYERNLLFTLEDKYEARQLEEIMNQSSSESILIFPSIGVKTSTRMPIIYGILDPLKKKDLKVEWLPETRSKIKSKKTYIYPNKKNQTLPETIYSNISRNIELEALIGKLFTFFREAQTTEDSMSEKALPEVYKHIEFMMQQEDPNKMNLEKDDSGKAALDSFNKVFFKTEDLFQTDQKKEELEASRVAFATAMKAKSPLLEVEKVLKSHIFIEGFKDSVINKGVNEKKGIVVDYFNSDPDVVGEVLLEDRNTYFSMFNKSENGFSINKNEGELKESEKVLFHQGFNYFSTEFAYGFSEKYNKIRAVTRSTVLMDSGFALELLEESENLAQSKGTTYVYIGNTANLEEKEETIGLLDDIIGNGMFSQSNSHNSITPTLIDGHILLAITENTFGNSDKRESLPKLGRAIYAISEKNKNLDTVSFYIELEKFSKMDNAYIINNFSDFTEDQATKARGQYLFSMDTINRTLENHCISNRSSLSTRRMSNGFLSEMIDVKVNETLVTQRQILKAGNIVKKVPIENIFRTLTTLSEKEKVFPNLQYINAQNVSLKMITESPIMALQYARFKNIAPIIYNAMNARGLTPPSLAPYEFDMVNKENNILPDNQKDVEIDVKEKNGIVNLKNFPALIKINSNDAIESFIDTSVQAILKTLGNSESESMEMYDVIKDEFTKTWGEKLKKSSYAILKSESYMEGTDLVKKEKFVLIDDALNELEDSVLNIPIFEFSKILEEKKLLNKEDRVKSAVFREVDINNVFDSFVGNIATGFQSEPVIFGIIKENFAKFFTAANLASEMGKFQPVSKEYISQYLDNKNKKEDNTTASELESLGLMSIIVQKLKKEDSIDKVVESSFEEVFKDNAISASGIILKQKAIKMFKKIRQKKESSLESVEIQDDSFSSKLKESGLTKAMMKFLSEKMLTPTEISKKVFSEIYSGPLDFKKINARGALKEFIEDSFKDKEHHYYKNDEMNKISSKLIEGSILSELPEAKELTSVYLDIISEESVKDFNLQESALSMINGVAFMDFMIRERKKSPGNELSAKQKTDLLQIGLTKVFKLRPHQAKLTMGLLSLYLSGKITVSNVWWLMRTGKTATTLATLLLVAWTTESNSAFFIQKKNFVDILNQMFRMWPLALAHNTTALGPNKKYNITEAKAPLVVTEWVYKNIPVALRDKLNESGKSLLKNPIMGSSLSPVEVIGETFGKDMELFIKSSKEITDEQFKKITRKNSKLLDYNLCMKETIIPDTDPARVLAKAFYFYLVKIIREGFLPPAVKNSASGEVVKKMYHSHWGDYLSESKLKKRTSGGLVLIGKQFISGFDASEEITKTHKIKRKGNPPTIITEKNVTFSDREIRNEDIISNKLDDLLKGMSIPDFSGEEVLLPTLLTSSTESGNKKRKQQNESMAKSASEMFIDLELIDLNEKMDMIPNELYPEDYEDDFYDDMDILYASAIKVFDNWAGFSFPITPKNTSLNYIISEGSPAEGLSVDISYKIEELKLSVEGLRQKNRPEVFQTIFEEISKNFTEKGPFARKISESMYKCIGMSIINSSILGSQASIKRRIGLFSGLISPKSVSFFYNFNEETNLIAPIKQKALTKKEIEDKVVQEKVIIEILSHGKVPNQTDPSKIEDKKLYPKEAFLVVNESGEYFISYEKLSYKEEDKTFDFIEKYKRFNANYTSPTMWYFGEKTSIIGIGIDEIHKTIKGRTNLAIRKLGDAGGVCGNPDYKDLSIFITYLTGTPYTGNLSIFSDLITTQSSPEMSKLLSKEIRKHNGNFKITDQVMAFMINKKNHSPELEIIFHEALIESFKKILQEGSKTNISEIVEKMRLEIVSDPKVFSSLVKFSDENDFHSIPSSAEMIKSFSIMIKDVIKILSKEFKKKVKDLKQKEEVEWREDNPGNSIPASEKINILNRATATALKSFDVSLIKIEETIIEGRTILARPAPGLSNLVSMAAITGYTDSNVSIKSLSDEMQYITLDSKDGEFDRKENPKIEIDEEIILSFEDIIAKYRRRLALSATYNSFRNLMEVAVTGIKEHGKSLLGLTSVEVNELINQTKSSKSDGILDIMKDSIVYEKDIPQEKEEVSKLLISIVNYIADHEQENIKKLSETLEDGEYGTINISSSHKIKIKVEELTGLTFSFNMANNKHIIASYEKATKQGPGHENKNFLALRDNGIYMIASDKNGKINLNRRVAYMTSLETKPFKYLPEIKSKINITYNDEASLINVAAGITKIKDTLLKHIDKGENTRTMTTRTDITKYALEATIQALLERSDDSMKHYILLNETSDEISKFRNKINQDPELVSLLRAKKIIIQGVSVEDLETLVEPILSQGSNLHFIGNIASSAEGVNNDYIQVGMFLGPLNEDPNITTQSVARQTGNNQEKSFFYFYGGGGVYHKMTKKEQNQNPIVFLDSIEKGLSVKLHEKDNIEKNRMRFMIKGAITFGKSNITTPAIVKANKSAEINLQSSNTFITGNPEMYNLSELDNEAIGSYVKDFISSGKSGVVGSKGYTLPESDVLDMGVVLLNSKKEDILKDPVQKLEEALVVCNEEQQEKQRILGELKNKSKTKKEPKSPSVKK